MERIFTFGENASIVHSRIDHLFSNVVLHVTKTRSGSSEADHPIKEPPVSSQNEKDSRTRQSIHLN